MCTVPWQIPKVPEGLAASIERQLVRLERYTPSFEALDYALEHATLVINAIIKIRAETSPVS